MSIKKSEDIATNTSYVENKGPDDPVAALVIDLDEEKAVLRKIDRVVLPVMALVFFFQYLDKQGINYAAVFGLQQDLRLTGQQFSWSISLFYFGQLCSEYPAAYLMSRLSVVRFVAVTIVLWGSTEMCLAASRGFGSLAAVRFVLGFAEGAVAPCFMIITSSWYKRSEHPLRIATWISMFGPSQIAGALIMYGVGQTETSLESWRITFLICGGLTVLAGTLFICVMPCDCSTAWFLNEAERKIAVERLALDRVTRDHNSFDTKQLKEALADPRTIHYALMALVITIPTPIIKFSSLVIEGFGFSKLQTMLVGLPGGAVTFCLTWIGALGPIYYKNCRCLFGILLASIPLIGSILLLALPDRMSWGIVASTWFAGSSAPPLAQAIGLMASNVRGNTKKSVVGALFFVFYSIGCIVGPQLTFSTVKCRTP